MSKSRRKARVSQKERLRRMYQSHTSKGMLRYSDGGLEDCDPDEYDEPQPPLRMTMNKKTSTLDIEEDDVV